MKKVVKRLLPWIITAVLIAAIVIFVGIPLYATPEDEVKVDEPIISYYEGDKTPLVLESDAIKFEMDPTTTHFSVTDKASGRVWLSNPANADKDPVAVSTNKENLQATAIVTYSTTAGTADLNNYKYSIENGTYSIDTSVEGQISVDYAIGKIEKVYQIPTAITKERFVAFTDAMKKSTAKKVKSNYTLYEPEKLDSKKNKDEIIAMYPEVLNQALYVLKDGTSENNKAKIEGYFAEINYSPEDFEIDQQLVAQKADNSGPVFNVRMTYRLEGNDLVLEIPYEKIRYKASNPITYITPLPMFGAAGTSDEGYMFIPEGSGALIKYNNGKLSQNSYYANTYGWDYATRRDEVVNETRNTFPVFGMSTNGGSFLCFMEGATSYGGVQADISNRYNSYNWMCARYNVLHSDQYNVSAKTAQLVFMFEQEIPDDTIIHRYRFLDTDNYVDLANAYGDYLRAKDPVLAQAAASAVNPVSVELVGAIDKTVVKFGLPVDSVFATTTFEQAQEIISDMTDKGVENLNIRYTGWANGGVNQQVLTSVNTLWELGGKEGMQKLIKAAKDKNVPLYFDGVTCFAYDSSILEGFIPFSHAARFTTREEIEIHPYNSITYQQTDWMDSYYLARPDFAKNAATNLINALKDVDAYGVAFRDIGYLLSADYNPKDTTTREEVKAMNLETMAEAKAAGQKIMIKQGNDYALSAADLITDMDLAGTRYSIIDQMVPFYQIALHGLKDYTGQPINLADDSRTEFLRCVEYGAGLNFTFMAEDGKVLQDTLHTNFFGANYDKWEEDVIALITEYQKDMAGLNQQRIVSHEKLTEYVTVTGYADGTKVYVNYGSEDATADSVTIPARDYTVERGM